MTTDDLGASKSLQEIQAKLQPQKDARQHVLDQDAAITTSMKELDALLAPVIGVLSSIDSACRVTEHDALTQNTVTSHAEGPRGGLVAHVHRCTKCWPSRAKYQPCLRLSRVAEVFGDDSATLTVLLLVDKDEVQQSTFHWFKVYELDVISPEASAILRQIAEDVKVEFPAALEALNLLL